jgi:hypothetical protein
MFIIFKDRDSRWAIGYYEYDGNHTFKVTARCKGPMLAAAVCSWLNGGSQPALETVEWVGQ